MGKSSPPPAPDYAAAAQATAQGDLQSARAATAANRVNQYTPYGSLEYKVTGTDPFGNPTWSSYQNLSPEQQKLLDQQNKISLGLGNTMDQGLGYVQNMLDSPFDTSQLPSQIVNPGQTVQDAIMSRLAPQFEQQQSRLETQLANQGIGQGTEAYRNAMTQFQQGRNDAMTQAALQGMSTQQQARQQALQEQSFLRNEPLNTLNAVRTGAQVTSPTFTNAAQQATTSGPNMLGAAQAQYGSALDAYNAKQAQQGGLMGGLFGLGGAALGSPWLGGLFG